MLPQSLETEFGLLGAILNYPDALDRVRHLVAAEDFCEPLHAKIFDAMCAQRDAGDIIDSRIITVVLGDQDLGGLTVGGYVARLYAETTTISGAPGYARIIRHFAVRRRLIATGEDMIRVASAPSADFDPLPVAKGAIAELDGIVTAATPKNLSVISIGEAAREAVKLAEDVRAGRKTVGIAWGLPSLDRATLGLVPGELVVAGGRPGMGKTTVASAVAMNVAQKDIGVGVISMEMHGVPLAQRILSSMVYDARREVVPYNAIARATDLSDKAIAMLEDARLKLADTPLWIEQERGLTAGQIAARARQMKTRSERAGKRFGVLVVDHLGLIQPSTRYAGNRVQEITELTRAMKILAGELDVCVLLLSQLSRALEGRPLEERRPQKNDFRDSGSIEQDADVILGLFREAYYLENKEQQTDEDLARLYEVSNVLEIEVLKQRQGPLGRHKFFCDIGCNVISELHQGF